MTKKDYELIASAIKNTLERDELLIRDVVKELSIALKLDNPSFKVDKFKEACEPRT